MSSSTQKPTEIPFDPAVTPVELSSSLSELECALSPLLSQEWAAQMDGLSPLERAKMDVMIAYTIVDLIWVYLKMKGVDPAKHEVTAELERVRAYYGKIRSIENPQADARKFKVDVPAAGRFILNGIPKNQRLANPNTSTADLPESSAAGAAQKGRERAEREQQASIDRMGKAGRMRFVPTEAERLVPGSAATEDDNMEGGAPKSPEEEEEEEVEEVEEVEILEVDDNGSDSDFEMLPGRPGGAGSGARTPAELAGELFAEVDKGLAKAKRKRAEEF